MVILGTGEEDPSQRAGATGVSALILGGRKDGFTSRAHALAQRVETAILRGELQPGHRLGTKAELQRDLGVAAGTLNEALRVLQIGGLIEVRPGPGGGVFVTAGRSHIKVRDGILRFRAGRSVQQCIAVRNALEELIAVEAARSYRPEDIDCLNDLLNEMASSTANTMAFVALNWALHRRIAEIGTNTVLTSIYCALLDFIEDALEEAGRDEIFNRHGEKTLSIHRNLVDAIASGDEAAAAQAAREHTPEVISLARDVDGPHAER